jgi:outer membrane lipopolysaccharide assembly protein LptE/RlpB
VLATGDRREVTEDRLSARRDSHRQPFFRPLSTAPVLLILVFLLLTSCGYHNPYSGAIADSSVSIHIPIWENRTNIAGLEYTFLEAMHGWFRKNSHINTVSSPEQADFTLNGEIASVNLPGLSYGQYEKVTESEARLTVSFTLMSGKNDFWKEKALVLEEAFLTGSDAEQYRANLNNALSSMAEDLAESVYFKMISSRHEKQIPAAK